MNKLHSLESLFLSTLDVWACRITSGPNLLDLDLDKTYDFFQSIDGLTRMIVSEEGGCNGVKLHQHILFGFEDAKKYSKKQITDWIKELYSGAKGNKYLYVKPATDKKQLIKYTIKEGHFKQMGFTDKFIADALRVSSKKTDMKKQFSNLIESVQLNTITIYEYIEKYVALKVDHNQPLYKNHLMAHFTMVCLKTKSLSLKDYCRQFDPLEMMDADPSYVINNIDSRLS